MFAFVSVSHPDQIKDRKKQAKLRQHAIRNGIQRSRADRAKKEDTFVPVEIDGKTGQPIKRTPPDAGPLTKAPSASLMDPFDTLCGCPERLRTLMRHRKYPHTLLFDLAVDTIQQQQSRPASPFSASRIRANRSSKAWRPYSEARWPTLHCSTLSP